MIILSSAQAASVRGPTSPGFALDPLALADGETFILPVAVLDDPAHEMHHALLAGLPRHEVAPHEWPQASD